LAAAVEAACAAGVDWLQLRDRELEGAAWLAWARELVGAARRGAARDPARNAPPTVLVNRRLDVALALAADAELPIGAHLGFDAVAVQEARDLLGPQRPVGVSAHAAAEVRDAARAGASYAHLAPIFAPISQKTQIASRSPLGLQVIAAAAGAGIPVVAQGGQDAARWPEVAAAGAAGMAVTGAILLAADPGEAAASLRASLDAATLD
jgi:thiamine-phosphate pyrophosphorylase